jgi:hypothetical protein
MIQTNIPLFMNKHFNKLFYKLISRLFGVGSLIKSKLSFPLFQVPAMNVNTIGMFDDIC